MNFEVRLEKAVAKTLDRVDRATERRLRNRIRELAADPYDPRLSRELTAKEGLRKSRAGLWRIVYEVKREVRIIDVVAIQPRGQVYKRL